MKTKEHCGGKECGQNDAGRWNWAWRTDASEPSEKNGKRTTSKKADSTIEIKGKKGWKGKKGG